MLFGKHNEGNGRHLSLNSYSFVRTIFSIFSGRILCYQWLLYKCQTNLLTWFWFFFFRFGFLCCPSRKSNMYNKAKVYTKLALNKTLRWVLYKYITILNKHSHISILTFNFHFRFSISRNVFALHCSIFPNYLRYFYMALSIRKHNFNLLYI